jgi:hypothetical protein
MTDLEKLAARVEALAGPCREADEAIYAIKTAGFPVGARSVDPPAFTASLDAAMTLVPANCLAMARHLWDDPVAGTRAGYASVARYADQKHVGETTALAATPALALTAAALRALAAQIKEQNND